jgi:glutamate mutase epsilon subunit
LGKPLNYEQVSQRTQAAKLTTSRILASAFNYSNDSVMVGRTIVVSNDKERVTVSEDVTNVMKQKCTRNALKISKENNLQEIKRVLNWKKMIVELMNFNFDKAFVRDSGQVDLDHARTTVITREDGKVDSDVW